MSQKGWRKSEREKPTEGKEFSEKELAILRKGEKQVRQGDFVWWRDTKANSDCLNEHL